VLLLQTYKHPGNSNTKVMVKTVLSALQQLTEAWQIYVSIDKQHCTKAILDFPSKSTRTDHHQVHTYCIAQPPPQWSR